MRLIFSGLLVIFISSGANSQDVKKLIENRQYNTAFKQLEKLDPENTRPEVVIQKVDLAINYFITSVMHQVFAFKDLRRSEELLEIRGTEGKYDMYSFSADSILLNLIETYPMDMDLHRSLGMYYFDAHYRYGNQWLIPEDSLINLFRDHFKIALINGSYDHESIYIIGYASLLQENYLEAVEFFNQSVNLKEDQAMCHYNLAYAYMALDEWVDGLFQALRAMELYEDNKWKGDAARMVAISYDELGNLPKSLDFFRQSNLLNPNNYYTIKPMLMVTSKIGNETDIRLHSKDLFDLDPDNPTVYQDLIEVYYGINAQRKLLAFLDHQLVPYSDDIRVKGSIHFYKGVIFHDLKEMEESQKSFKKAQELFREVYEPGNPVFPTIESYLNSF